MISLDSKEPPVDNGAAPDSRLDKPWPTLARMDRLMRYPEWRKTPYPQNS